MKQFIWVGVLAIIFGYLWWRGYIKRFAAYWQQTVEELKKCAWPNWDDLSGSTILVMVATFLLALFTFIADQIFFVLFKTV